MLNCPACSKELSEDTKFCDGCGAKIVETIFCPNCGQQTSTEFAFCQACGASLGETPEQEQPAEAPKQKKKLPKKAILFGAIGAVAVAAVVLVICLLFGGRSQQNYALYLKDGELYFNALGKNSESLQVSKKLFESDPDESVLANYASRMGYWTCVSNDGKYVFYPDKVQSGTEYVTLYFRQTSDPEAKAQKIDSDVSEYTVNEAGTVVTYLKGTDADLYQYNIKKDSKEKLAGDVDSMYVSADGKKVLYRNTDNDLYLKTVGGDKEKIASDVSSLSYISEDCKTVYYRKEDTLYKQVIGKDKEKIASDVTRVLRVYDSGEIYYLTEEVEELSLADFVEDDLAETDAAMTRPTYPTYPDQPVYPTYPSYPVQPDYPYWWEYDTTAQYNAAYATYEKEYKQWQEDCDRIDAEYYAACDTYEAEYEAWQTECSRLDAQYDAAMDAFWAKQDRDSIREDLAETMLEQSVYTLYYYDGQDKTLVTEAFEGNDYNYTFAADAAVMVYEVYDWEDVEKVKFSQAGSMEELEEMVQEEVSSARDWYIAVKETVTLVEQVEQACNFTVNASGTLVYYADEVSEDYHGELYRISIDKGIVGEPEAYDSDVYHYAYFLDDTHIRYFKNSELDEDTYVRTGDLYIDKEQIDEDVCLYYLSADAETGTLCYYTDWDEGKRQGTLKIYNGKDAEEVADEVHDYEVLPDGRILYLYDYSLSRYEGELYEWNNGKTREIDDDVVAIVPFIMTDTRGGFYVGW